jgi:hypothetical protein
MAEQIVQIKSLPGIKRDGTKFEGDQYVDGQWVRFQRGLPRKIGGYRSINKYLLSVARTLHEYTQDNLTYIHAGSANRVERFFIDGNYNTSVITDRTPATGFTQADTNLWQFDVAYDTTNGNQLVAQVAPNLECICNSEGGELFTGDLLGTGPLTPVTNVPANFNCTGGVVTLPPYTFAFGNDGYVAWSVPNNPSDFTSSGANNANVTGQKIVRGMPLRGGPGNSPSGLFWSADALIRASYVGGVGPTFQFDTISTQTSIMSAACVIEYDGIFYWIGTDRFLQFNGVVREVENNVNQNFFFDNINMAQRQKVFALKVPRYGEIWWCFPKGDSLEPNHAIIYNVRENAWYDTALPNGGRAAGLFPAVFRKPLMSGCVPYFLPDDIRVTERANEDPGAVSLDFISGEYDARLLTVEGTRITEDGVDYRATEDSGAPRYKFWVHEVGTNEIDGIIENPIQSYFETADLSMPVMAQKNNALQVLMIEPDFVQSGPLTVQVKGRANARAPEVDGLIMTIPEVPSTPQEQVVYLKTQRRELRFRFESNCIGGDYQAGLILAHVQPGDSTVIG